MKHAARFSNSAGESAYDALTRLKVERVSGNVSIGEPPIRREGLRSDIWVLMDFGCVIVHVFTDEARKFYNLERLWSDSEEVALSSLPSP